MYVIYIHRYLEEAEARSTIPNRRSEDVYITYTHTHTHTHTHTQVFGGGRGAQHDT